LGKKEETCAKHKIDRSQNGRTKKHRPSQFSETSYVRHWLNYVRCCSWVLHCIVQCIGSCAPTQRSWTIGLTDFILHLHLHCRSIKFAPVSVLFPVSRLSLQPFCLPYLMLRSLHLIEVESIIAKNCKKKSCLHTDMEEKQTELETEIK